MQRGRIDGIILARGHDKFSQRTELLDLVRSHGDRTYYLHSPYHTLSLPPSTLVRSPPLTKKKTAGLPSLVLPIAHLN